MRNIEQHASEGVNKILIGNKADVLDKKVPLCRLGGMNKRASKTTYIAKRSLVRSKDSLWRMNSQSSSWNAVPNRILVCFVPRLSKNGENSLVARSDRRRGSLLYIGQVC